MAHQNRHVAARSIVVAIAANLTLAALVAGSQARPGYLAVDEWSAEAQGSNSVRLTVSTDGLIPKQPDAFINDHAIVGVAWVDADTWTALVATIHPVLGRDSNQRPDSWHLHTVTLNPVGATAPNDVCLVSVDTTPTAGINLQGSLLSVNLDRTSMPRDGGGFVGPEAIDMAAGFTVHGDDACGSGLAVRIRT